VGVVDNPDHEPPDDEPAPPAPGRAVIKRRWAILRGTGGGVVVLAVAGAIALSDPNEQSDYSADSAGGDHHISTEE
jgi:hypothetical protein